MKYLKVLSVAFLASVVIILSALFSSQVTPNASASINIGNDYAGATTTLGMGSSTKNQIQLGQTTLGSIIISSTSAAVAGNIVVKNATSTLDAASTTIASFSSGSANGTYTFDVAITRGLFIELPTGFNGAYTITYR